MVSVTLKGTLNPLAKISCGYAGHVSNNVTSTSSVALFAVLLR